MNKVTSISYIAGSSRKFQAFLGAFVAISMVITGLTFNFGAQATAAPTQTDLDIDSFGLVSGEVATVDISGQQEGVGSFSEGSLVGYIEGSCLPMVINASHTVGSNANIEIEIEYDYSNNGVVGIADLELVSPNFDATNIALAQNLSNFTYTGSSLTASQYYYSDVDFVSSTVTEPAPTTSGNREIRYYTVTLLDVPTDTDVNVYLCARFGLDASQYSNGSDMSVSLTAGGAQKNPISPSNLIELASLTIEKTVIGGEASADDFSFTVSPAINNVSEFSIPEGEFSVTIENILIEGNYTITESGPAGYAFTDGTGTSCVFSEDGTATATVAHETTDNVDPIDATCTFTNSVLVVPTITVVKEVISTYGGTADAVDFTGLMVNNIPHASGTVIPVMPGSYELFENLGAFAGTYELTDITCVDQNQTIVANGTTTAMVTVDYQDDVTCTFTNSEIEIIIPPNPTTLTVVKEWDIESVGDINPQSLTDQFTFTYGGTTILEGVATEVPAGTYTIEESTESEFLYEGTFDGACTGGDVTLAAGDDVICTITNRMLPIDGPTITIIKEVVGGTAAPADFSFLVDNTSEEIGVIMTTGQTVGLRAGNYIVSENSGPTTEDYTPSFSGDCATDGSITMVNLIDPTEEEALTNNYTCTITNTYNEPAETSVTVIVTVINDDGGTLTEPGTTMQIFTGDALDILTATFPGDSAGTTTDLAPSTDFDVAASTHEGYDRNMTGTCEGRANEGDTHVCYVTYNDIAPPSNGGGGGGGSCPICVGDNPDPAPTPAPAPDPIVLGDTDEQPPAAPAPEVAGTTDELPRTGTPIALVGLTAMIAMAATGLRRRT